MVDDSACEGKGDGSETVGLPCKRSTRGKKGAGSRGMHTVLPIVRLPQHRGEMKGNTKKGRGGKNLSKRPWRLSNYGVAGEKPAGGSATMHVGSSKLLPNQRKDDHS